MQTTRPSIAVIFLYSLIVLCFSGCSKPTPPPGSKVDGAVRGEWTSERSYSNTFFGVSINIPSEWNLIKGDEKNWEYTLKGIENITGRNQSVRNSYRTKYAEIHIPVRVLFEDEENTAKNPNLVVMIENIEAKPLVKTGADFLNAMDQTMNASPLFPAFDGPASEIKLNGIDFWTRTSRLDIKGGESLLFSGARGLTVHQQGYSMVKGHYALTILRTWFSSRDDPTSKLVDENLTALLPSVAQRNAGQPAPPIESKRESKE